MMGMIGTKFYTHFHHWKIVTIEYFQLINLWRMFGKYMNSSKIHTIESRPYYGFSNLVAVMALQSTDLCVYG